MCICVCDGLVKCAAETIIAFIIIIILSHECTIIIFILDPRDYRVDVVQKLFVILDFYHDCHLMCVQ